MKLSVRIVIATTSLIVMMTIGMLLFVNERIRMSLENENLHWGKVLAESIAISTIDDLIERRSHQLREILRRIVHADPRITYLVMTDFKGQIVAHTFDGPLPNSLLFDALTSPDNSDYMITEKNLEGMTITESTHRLIEDLNAFVRIGIDQKGLKETTGTTIRDVMLIGLLSLVLGVIGAGILARTISRPIRSLSETMKAYGQGMVLKFPDLGRLDSETKQLVKNFQEMVHQKSEIEDGLRKKEELIQTIISNLPVVLFSTDREGVFTFTGSKGLEKAGITSGSNVGENIFDIYKHDQNITNSAREALAGKSTHSISKSYGVYFERWYRPLLDNSGQVAGVTGISIDVSERIQAQEELQASEEKYRNLIEGSIEGVAIIQNLKLMFANRAIAEMYGFEDPEELIGLNSLDLFVAPAEKGRIKAMHLARMRGEEVSDRFEFQGVRKDGSLIWLECLAINVEWFGQTATQVTYIDITERKQVEDELRESEEKFRSLVESSLLGIFIHQDFKLLFVNKAYAEIFGFESPEDVLQLDSFDSLIHPDDISGLKNRTQKTLDGRVLTPRHEHRGIRKDGRTIYLDTHVVDFMWEGQLARMGTIIDLTESKKTEDQLRQAQKMESVGQLAGGMAHDFNNMLQIISGYTELALSRNEISDEITNDLHQVRKASESAAGLTRQLLVFSRQNILSLRALDINDLIRNLMKLLGRLLGAELELQVISGDDLGSIHGDPGMIEQVLMNICVNARDAMPEGGRLVIETRRFEVAEAQFKAEGWENPGGYVLISVSDNGIGISKEAIPKIFDPFFTTKEAEKGTGLGLSVVHGIVKQHNGRLTVYSEVGKGTTFNIFLPIAKWSEVGFLKQKAVPVVGGIETILVADDEAEILQLTTELLEDQGYTVLAANDGEEAVSIFNEHRDEIALAILDLSMPKLNGRGVYNQIHSHNPKLPFIFDSGYPAGIIDQEFFESTHSKLIQKPFTPSTLFQAVREALDRA